MRAHLLSRLVLTGSVVGCLLGCGDSTDPAPIPTSVVVQLARVQLDPGDTTRAAVVAMDGSGRALPVQSPTFVSSNSAIARVDTAGLVTATTEGSATITATVRGISGTVALSVSYTVNTVGVTAARATLEADDTARVTVVPLSAKGVVITGRDVAYATSNAAVATVSESGLVRGMGVGTATITATVDGKSGSVNVTVQTRAVSVVASQESLRLGAGATVQLSAQAFDETGNALPGRPIEWSSDNVLSVAVTAPGELAWRGPGQANVIARVGGAADTVRVSSDGDFAITAVHLTQGVQDAEGSIPLIAQGRPVALLVLMSSAAMTQAPSTLILRLTDATGTLVFSDTESVAGPVGPTPFLAFPTASFLVPATQLRAGRRWQVLRDASQTPDDTAANDVYPRNGSTAFAITAVPPLAIRFVPITLSAHGGSTPPITGSDLPGYLRTALSTLPLGQVDATIGAPFTTGASFGTPPSGGGESFWTQVLQALDAARVASTDPTAHWYGVVGPPTGFNFTQFGGFAYVPANPASSANFTRTGVGVRTGWFSNQAQARDLVAHELSHNFGRRHAPCGNPAGSVDPTFPRADGRIGQIMHDVHGWEGAPALIVPIPAETGDIMGYCFPGWASAYTYNAILNWRGPGIAAAVIRRTPAEREEVIVVQGSVSASGAITLHGPIAMLGFPTPAQRSGEHVLEGLDDSGRVLFERWVQAEHVDHADVRLFTIALPVAVTSRVSTLRVRSQRESASLSVTATPPAPDVRADGAAALRIGCGHPAARVAVQDAVSGDVIGIASGSLRIADVRGKRLGVSCGRGASARRTTVLVP